MVLLDVSTTSKYNWMKDSASRCWDQASNVPIGAITFFLILIFLKMKREERQSMTMIKQLKQLDLPGAGALIASLCCLFLSLQWGGQSRPWNSPTIIGLLTSFGILFTLFCIIQWKMGENATIPLRVLRQRSILFGSLFLFFIAMSGYIVRPSWYKLSYTAYTEYYSTGTTSQYISSLSKDQPLQRVVYSSWLWHFLRLASS